MLTQSMKKNPIFNLISNTIVSLPAPKNLSFMWNIGSLLAACLAIQIITGLLLATSYAPAMDVSFKLVSKMMELMDKGWLLRYLHANGASLFFICLYVHMGRGIYYNSYAQNPHTWLMGVTIFLLVMATAFLGYVLPANQMSYWGASVITNLFSEVPYLGSQLVQLIWGSTSVGDPTLMRFFTFHFILPFIVAALVILHITLLHTAGSNNPLGLNSNTSKLMFHPFFTIKDLFGLFVMLTLFTGVVFMFPLILGDNENFTQANPAVTPNHIQPEWYFLFAYAILRSIPNKLGGIIALAMSVLILYALPYFNMAYTKSSAFDPINKTLFYVFISIVIMLTWIGARPVEDPYVEMGQYLTFAYFMYYLIQPELTVMSNMINAKKM